MQLRWIASQSTSSLHAACAISRGLPLADARAAEELEPPARALIDELNAAGVPLERFWRYVIPFSAGVDNNRELADLSLLKAVGRRRSESLVASIVPLIGELEAAMGRAAPRLLDELTLRGGPLRQQWEARGPGLLHRVQRLTDENLLAPSADVILVRPVLGGGGAAHLFCNTVHIEAVLANPLPELPETVRLGWLLSQLHLETPQYSESISPDRLPWIAQMAMLPPILHAAEEVELAGFDRAVLQQAVDAWRIDSAAPEAVDLLWDWWETYKATRPTWSMALTALDRLLG